MSEILLSLQFLVQYYHNSFGFMFGILNRNLLKFLTVFVWPRVRFCCVLCFTSFSQLFFVHSNFFKVLLGLRQKVFKSILSVLYNLFIFFLKPDILYEFYINICITKQMWMNAGCNLDCVGMVHVRIELEVMNVTVIQVSDCQLMKIVKVCIYYNCLNF